MARVNVEKIALSDSRFDVLAKMAALADRDHALGKMVRIWNECQERESHNLPGAMLDAIIGRDGSGELLVASSLAKRTRAGLFYIRGTRGRIEWLRERRKEGRKGGKLGGRPKEPLGDSKTEPLGGNGNTTGGNPSGSGSFSEVLQKETPKPPRASRAVGSYPEGFLRAWDAYPHYGQRSKKPKSAEVWRKSGLESLTESVLGWIDAGKRTEDWKRDEGQYVPAMQQWLGGRDFTEPPTKPQPIKQAERSVLPWDKQNRLLTPEEIAARRDREARELKR